MKQLQVILKLITELTLFVLLSFCCARIAFAQVIINEVMPAPTQGNEWVELKNLTNQSVSLSGWKVEDDSGAVTPIPVFSQASVDPFGLFVFEVKNRLNNTGDQVLLRRPDLSRADFFQYTSSSAQQSWSRVSADKNTFILALPTKGAENMLSSPDPSMIPSPAPQTSPSILPTPTVTPSASPSATPQPSPVVSPLPSPIIFSSPSPLPVSSPSPSPILLSQPLELSEIVGCAETGHPEWFELYNPNSVTVTLRGWKVKDSSSNTRTFDSTLSPQSYGVVELSSALLNNDGDSFSLIDQTGTELLHIELGACLQNQSTIYTTQGWVQTGTVTKGTANIFTSTLPSPTPQPTSSTMSSVEPLLTSSSPTTQEPALPLLQNFLDQNSLAMQVSSAPDILGESSSPILTSARTEVATPAAQITASSLPSSAFPSKQSNSENSASATESDFAIPSSTRTILLTISLAMVGCGCYGCYEWYTEQRVNKTLEIL